VLLETDWLRSEIQIAKAPNKLAKIAEMDNPRNMNGLAVIGRVAVPKQVKPELPSRPRRSMIAGGRATRDSEEVAAPGATLLKP
jgi:hypothetical protein